jgi:hypothetical protein
LKRKLTRADADAIRAEVDRKRGFPRVHPESEVQRFGVGIHVETIVTTTAVAIDGDGADVSVTLDDADERHVAPARRARLRAAKEPVEDSRSPEDRNPKIKR